MPTRLASSTAVVLLAGAALSVAVPGAQAEGAAGSRTVAYQGYQVRVPGSWQVVDLAQDPHSCIRFDRNVVYLGTPSADQNCPADLGVGRTDALLIQPVPAPAPGVPATPVVAPGSPLPPSVLAAGAGGHQLQAELRGTGLEMTASYGTSPQQVNAILAGATVHGTPSATAPSTATAPSAAAPVRPSVAGRSSRAATSTVPSTDAGGKGFDTCTAPSAAAMTAWSGGASPYQSVGIYIGGPAQTCAQPNLTPGWVAAQAAQGWSFLPMYAGQQAATGSALISADLPTATNQGAVDAADAVTKAAALGFTPGAVLYNDMEAYNSALSKTRVLAYLSGWTAGLHNAGYRSGVYSSANSGIADVASQYNVSTFPRPDVIWSGSWNSSQDTSDAGMGLPGPTYWPAYRRVHQYAGGVNETWGGVQLNIDDNAVNVGSTATGAVMTAGQRLEAGQSISSPSMTLTMQSDGNLVAYANTGGSAQGAPMWSAGTSGNPGAYLLMQWDGNLVLYGANGAALWSTGSWGNPGASVTVQAGGNVVLSGANGSTLWSSGTGEAPQTLDGGQSLAPGQWTAGQLTELMMQADGNLVMYRKADGAVLWSTNTSGNSGAYVTMQADGNFVVYRKGGGPSAGGALWSSGTWNNPGAYAIMQDDGNLVVYRQGGGATTGGALWASGTYGAAN
ncbi:glycoside hydrolase domain-containing protein [Kitasatospora sp. NPDC052896]|uniref:glycoside hydrolase domain-containing protein n=1 Tax=Kitasatospora sp. NPDC052896 TaxID=3364061 RepID=UPI0037C81A5B